MKARFYLLAFSLGIVSLFLFSFTQIDLSLTLSKVSIWQGIQKSFQQVGYFERNVSTIWYLLTLAVLFTSYIAILIKVRKGEIENKKIWKLILFVGVVLLFSYNAFSYDIFNYVFYGKIVTFYHQNPYLYKALDFPSDPMLSFMHWTHNTYPYGPSWLGVSVVLSYIGLNLFTLTFFLFKLLALSSYLASSYLVQKISSKIKTQNPNFNLTFFALSPLVIIEGLVSAHNDIFMMALALAGFYLLIQNKKSYSFVFLALSILIKWATAPLAAAFILYSFTRGKIKNLDNLVSVSLFFSSLGLIYALTKYEMQPWYFLWVFPFIALFKKTRLVLGLSIGISIGLLLSYAPFFLTGNWDPPIPTIKSFFIIMGGVVGAVCGYLYGLGAKKLKSYV